MKKLVLTAIISLIAISGSAFAQDCNLISAWNLGIIKDYTSFKYKNVVPQEAMQQALANLKAYCCKQFISTNPVCKAGKGKLSTSYPESAYLFDQLLDVTMRRLDGIKSLAYGLNPDPAGKERRDLITKTANTAEGAQAITIESSYKEYRTLHQKETMDLDQVAANYLGKNSPTLSLLDKYNKLCNLMKDIYLNLQEYPTIIWWKFENNSFFSACEGRVQDRIKRENTYVKMLMIQKSNQLLDETTKAYTKKHFVEEKLMGLRNIIANVKDTFKTIVQQAPASKMCSK